MPAHSCLHKGALAVLFAAAGLARAQCGPGLAMPYPSGTTVCPSGPPGGGGGAGGTGGSSAPTSTSAHAAALLGNVGKTTATGTDARTNKSFTVGQDLYGPFEAGFGSQQDSILQSLGCSTGSLGYVAGGIDTQTAEQMVAKGCGITLPRVSGNQYVSLLDECGGHTQYHFHERLSCLYNGSAPGHSTKVAATTGNQSLYGKWEATATLPKLDACGAHYGRTPESPSADVYHYHVQDSPPFTIGCIGPNDNGTVVTVAQCRAFYTGCDGVLVNISLPTGNKMYDLWCPCFDATGSNAGTISGVSAPGATGSASGFGGGRLAVVLLALPLLVRSGSGNGEL